MKLGFSRRRTATSGRRRPGSPIPATTDYLSPITDHRKSGSPRRCGPSSRSPFSSWCRCRSVSGRSCWCCRGRSCRCSSRCSRNSRRWRRDTAWRYTDVIDVLFVLSPARIKVVGGRVGDIASSVIGHDGDVVAYFVLIRPACQRSE